MAVDLRVIGILIPAGVKIPSEAKRPTAQATMTEYQWIDATTSK